MAPTFARPAPLWFRLVAVLLLLWGTAGIAAFYAHVTMGGEALAALSDHDRRFHLARPAWFDWIYATATWGGLLGAIALLAGRRVATLLFALSLLAVAVQFGWVFAGTDMIAAKGVVHVVPFPLLIFAIALLQLAVARHGVARGWLR